MLAGSSLKIKQGQHHPRTPGMAVHLILFPRSVNLKKEGPGPTTWGLERLLPPGRPPGVPEQYIYADW